MQPAGVPAAWTEREGVNRGGAVLHTLVPHIQRHCISGVVLSFLSFEHGVQGLSVCVRGAGKHQGAREQWSKPDAEGVAPQADAVGWGSCKGCCCPRRPYQHPSGPPVRPADSAF